MTGRTLTGFLCEMLAENAVQGGLAWCGLGQAAVEAIREAGARWERHTFADGILTLVGEGTVLRVPLPQGQSLGVVHGGARTAGGLQALAAEFGFTRSERRRRLDAPPEADEGAPDEPSRAALRVRAAAQAAAAGIRAVCAGCGASLVTWADTAARGVCSLCGHAI
jgi:hypothetical protein